MRAQSFRDLGLTYPGWTTDNHHPKNNAQLVGEESWRTREATLMQVAAAETPPPILARAEVAGAVGVAAVAGEVGAVEVAEAVVEKAGRKMVVLQRQTVLRTPIAAAMVDAAVHETAVKVVTK